MQEPAAPHAAPAALPRQERRCDPRKRAIVEAGMTAEPASVLARIEYLQGRNIEAHIIKRVLLRFFRGPTAAPTTAPHREPTS